MDRVSSSGYVTVGGVRYWQNKNLAAGIVGTTFDEVWFNGVDESIVGLIAGLGITPQNYSADGAPAADTQLLQAVLRAAAGNVTSVTANITLTADNAGLVLVSAAAGNVAITMPAAAAANGRPLRFKFVRSDTTSATVTFAAAGSDTFQSPALSAIAAPSLTNAAPLTLFGDGVSRWLVDAEPTGRRLGDQIFDTSGTYTPNPLMSWGLFLLIGGGGGSGGLPTCTSSEYAISGGASAGSVTFGSFTRSQIGASQSVVIGAGGAAGAAGGGSGGNGGASSLGSLMNAPGGIATPWAGPGTNTLLVLPGAFPPAAATGGNRFNAAGAAGSLSIAGTGISPSAGISATGGPGGVSPLGGLGPGAGGGGAAIVGSSGVPGNAGASGILLVTEFA